MKGYRLAHRMTIPHPSAKGIGDYWSPSPIVFQNKRDLGNYIKVIEIGFVKDEDIWLPENYRIEEIDLIKG